MQCSLLSLSFQSTGNATLFGTIRLHPVPAVLFKAEGSKHLETKLLGSSERTGKGQGARGKGCNQGLYNRVWMNGRCDLDMAKALLLEVSQVDKGNEMIEEAGTASECSYPSSI